MSTNPIAKTLDALSELNSIRYKMQNAFLSEVSRMTQDNTATPRLVKKGVDLLHLLSRRQIAVEKEVLSIVRRVIVPIKNTPEAGIAKVPTGPNIQANTAPSPQPLQHSADRPYQVIVPIDAGLFKIPIALANHDVYDKQVLLDVMPLQEVGGPGIFIDQLRLEKTNLVLKGQSSVQVIAFLKTGPELQVGNHYTSALFIGGDESKIINLLISIAPPQAEQGLS